MVSHATARESCETVHSILFRCPMCKFADNKEFLRYRDLRDRVLARAGRRQIQLLLDRLPKMNRRLEHLLEIPE